MMWKLQVISLHILRSDVVDQISVAKEVAFEV